MQLAAYTSQLGGYLAQLGSAATGLSAGGGPTIPTEPNNSGRRRTFIVKRVERQFVVRLDKRRNIL